MKGKSPLRGLRDRAGRVLGLTPQAFESRRSAAVRKRSRGAAILNSLGREPQEVGARTTITAA
ncbi:hypothetical protein SAMN06265222_101913 [Neorhodopirellula lusitana]|uniref:Uncharacterized protein n=1 Tax=Neorhodopirellula lusitana TaxID=445327 RepID=A0ABY1PTU1_9BACT|nr:hypothetical protein SAMN06265222_101913 [Neorhodopirellula lusitana]